MTRKVDPKKPRESERVVAAALAHTQAVVLTTDDLLILASSLRQRISGIDKRLDAYRNARPPKGDEVARAKASNDAANLIFHRSRLSSILVKLENALL